jgi:hypothetical protein
MKETDYAGRNARVLVVNETVSDASCLVTYLKKLGCQCVLFRSVRDARAVLLREQFDLVLCKFDVPGGDWHELPALLIGREVDLFYFYAVEGGCWWIPRIRHGNECRGEAALRPGEFAAVLEELIAGVRASADLARPH